MNDMDKFVRDNFEDAFKAVLCTDDDERNEERLSWEISEINDLIIEHLENRLSEWDDVDLIKCAKKNFDTFVSAAANLPNILDFDSTSLESIDDVDNEIARGLCVAEIIDTVIWTMYDWDKAGRPANMVPTPFLDKHSVVRRTGGTAEACMPNDDDCLKKDIPLKDFSAMNGINYVNVTEETKNENLLSFRPKSLDEKIPEDVYEARMSRLESVDRETLEKIFLKKPDYKAQYFGYAKSTSPAVNQLNMMSALAWDAPDAKSCERIFAVSVWGENMSDDNVRKLANITTNMVSDMKSKIQELCDLKAAELKESSASKFLDKD